ncbi:WD repeat-containing protein 60 isoform X1 [Silurus asotus]|uniref:WD repeat-containing protein 60 isoform X1 n=1 Tax=Silurus asotus TaxID=30991 RepID=A0AAD5FTE3_SILAS|nr:WD repeat-containing protein 60 isoform X1 [Silurus asotus]
MFSGKNREEDSRRTETSHRDPERDRRKHREGSGRRGETRDERERDPSETEYQKRERYKSRDGEKEKERDKGRSKERDLEREKRNREREKEKEREKRDKEKEREREKRDREKEREKRDREQEREKRDREKDGKTKDGEKFRETRESEKNREMRDREKDKKIRESEKNREMRDREKGRETRDRGKDREIRDRGKDRDREKRDREKEREREKRDSMKEREIRYREKERDQHRAKEGRRDRGEERDQEKDRERERRRAERENERRKEKEERKERRGDKERERGEEQNRERKERDRQDTGQIDREERRERMRREDREREQRHRPQEKDEKETGERRDQVEQDVVEDDAGAVEDYGNEGYEDDFEEYEEDFEDCDEEEEDKEEEQAEGEQREVERELSPHSRRELEDVRRAMEKENEMVITGHIRASSQELEIFPRDLRKSQAYGRVIDFTAARQRERNQQAAQKQKKRSAEILHLIDLDFSVTECLLDLPPVREYDAYIRSYGTANTKQAYVQCNEDNVERDTQTEDTDIMDKWTQHPPESSVACGGDGHDTSTRIPSDEGVTRTMLDSKRLTRFLHSSTQVMAVLLEENMAENNSVKKLQSQTHTHSFSDGCVQLNTSLSLLQGRQVTLLHFSQTQPHTLLSVHSPHSGSGHVTLDRTTLICVWNIWEPSTPQRLLIYETEVRSCCFSPGKAVLVFAGTDVGSVVLWDLREPSSSHLSIRVCEEEWTLRYPTFSTDAVLSGTGHFSAVISVEPVLANLGEGLRDSLLPDQEESMRSFQLGSLDENGLLNLWVVVELPRADDSGSQTDLGLRPGGKVKLLHSSFLQTTPKLDSGVTSHLSSVLKFLPSDSNHFFIGSNMVVVELPRADDSGSQTDLGLRPGGKVKLLHSSFLQTTPKLDNGVTSHLSSVLKFLPSDSNHFFIGSNMGLVRHGTRNGLHAVPKLYRPKDGETPADITALEFCPNGEPYFLVGCSDGVVRLHACVCEEAVCEWAVCSGSVQCVSFSPTRCSVFCTLDSASVLHIWDLTQRDESPVLTHDLHTDPVSTMAVFGDAVRQNPYSGVALGKRSGSLEIHFLLPSFTLPQPSDAEKLHLLASDTL